MKIDLQSLIREIETLGQGILDTYLLQFKGPRLNRGDWGGGILKMKGLDGLDDANQVDGDLSDPDVVKKYKKFDEQRHYSYSALDQTCKNCRVAPCVCDKGDSNHKSPGMRM